MPSGLAMPCDALRPGDALGLCDALRPGDALAVAKSLLSPGPRCRQALAVARSLLSPGLCYRQVFAVARPSLSPGLRCRRVFAVARSSLSPGPRCRQALAVARSLLSPSLCCRQALAVARPSLSPGPRASPGLKASQGVRVPQRTSAPCHCRSFPLIMDYSALGSAHGLAKSRSHDVWAQARGSIKILVRLVACASEKCPKAISQKSACTAPSHKFTAGSRLSLQSTDGHGHVNAGWSRGLRCNLR
jgi:hypothetical protein